MATGGDYLEKLKGWAAGDEIDRSKLKKCLKATPIGNKYTSAIQTAVETEMSKPGMTEKVKGRVNVAKNGEKLVQKIATEMKIDVEKVKSAIAETKVGAKEFKTSNLDIVNRLTDTSKYTGSHKERFDETGKGKGIDGREYRYDNKGYVTGYKGDGSYEDN